MERNEESKSSAWPDTSPDSKTIGEPLQLSSGILETAKDHWENLHDDRKMKLLWVNMEKTEIEDEMEAHCDVENIRQSGQLRNR